MSKLPGLPKTGRGFTLMEMAMVLVIVLVLMGGVITAVTSQVDASNQAQTEQTLSDIREALLGFAVAQGRLPCPAAPANPGAGSGVAVPDGALACSHGLTGTEGFVPGTTLGLTPTDPQGYVVDGWNRRIRYTVTNVGNFTTGMTITPPVTYLSICSALNGAVCAANATLTDNAVAVVYSLGKNGAGTGADERENRDGDSVFVSRDPSGSGAAGGEFDDTVTWLSPYTLYSRMIAAGRLP